VLQQIRAVLGGESIGHGSDYARSQRMKTLLVRGDSELPRELRDMVKSGSTEVAEVRASSAGSVHEADRVVTWNGNTVTIDDRRLRWPDDRDELKVLLQTAG
jgi:hypothetical protein